MKRNLSLALLLCLAGCATPAPSVRLAPGDKLIMDDAGRAAAIRQTFGTDTNHTGRVVLLERPLTLTP